MAACQTTARRVGEDLVINGQKMWITNAFQADWICLLANTEEGPGECDTDRDLAVVLDLEKLVKITVIFMLN